MAGAACMAHSQLCMHACVNEAWSAGMSVCCPMHCISMPPLCQEGLAAPIFQSRLRRFTHLSGVATPPAADVLQDKFKRFAVLSF
eukprot:1158664-Pelagomonas_calceolata.AAC.8